MKGLIVIITLLIITGGLVSCKSVKRKKQDNFRFRADDAFWLSDGRIVITGQVISGTIKKGEKLYVQIDSKKR
jgi:selenocysteine-specific translation elongation factor